MFDIGPSNRNMGQPQSGSPGMRLEDFGYNGPAPGRSQDVFRREDFKDWGISRPGSGPGNFQAPINERPAPMFGGMKPPQMKNPNPNFGGFFSGGMQHTMPVQPSGGMNFGSMSGGGAPKLPWMFSGLSPQTLEQLIQRFSGPRIGM